MKSMRKFIIIAVLMLIFSTNVFANENVMISDIDNHWAQNEINLLINESVVQGYSDNTFRPNNNITVSELKEYNNLTSNVLSIGQRLIIKKKDLINDNTYIVKKGDTLYSIARIYNINVNDIKRINNLTDNNLAIGQKLILPIFDSGENMNLQTYTVKKGDTLYNIAKNYNVSVSELKNINNLTSNILTIGQKLSIPS